MFVCLTNGIHGSETSHNATIKPAMSTSGGNLQNNYKEASLKFKAKPRRGRVKSGLRLDFRRNITPQF